MIGPHPNSRVHAQIIEEEARLAQVLDRMKSTPMIDYDHALARERLALTPIPMILTASVEIAAQALTGPILLLHPAQREAAALRALHGLSEHLRAQVIASVRASLATPPAPAPGESGEIVHPSPETPQ